MGVFTGDIDDLFPVRERRESSVDDPLGTRLRGRGGDGDLDAIAAVRDLRARR
jgi:hypothetical protein